MDLPPIWKYDTICDFKESYEKLKRVAKPFLKDDFSFKQIGEVVNKMEVEYKTKSQKVLGILSKYWGKYVHLRFSYNTNYKEDREINPEWGTDLGYNAMLYRYIPENGGLFGIFCKINDCFIGGVKYETIDITEIMEVHRLEINEITEEEFLPSAEDTLFQCLKTMCDKIKSGTYNLTKNGYKYSIFAKGEA